MKMIQLRFCSHFKIFFQPSTYGIQTWLCSAVKFLVFNVFLVCNLVLFLYWLNNNYYFNHVIPFNQDNQN